MLLLAAALFAHAAPLALMHGFADQSSVTLWAQGERPARLTIEFHPEADATALRRVEQPLARENDFVAHVRLANLDPGTRYVYRVLVDGKPTAIAPGIFATQPLWRFRDSPPELAIAFGSCAYLNDRYDRPGAPWGGDYRIFDAIAAQRPDLMLWLGDNVYFREPEWTSPEGMSARYRAYRTLPELAKLARATSHIAIWDDHDYGPNDADGSFVLKGAALETFKRYWPNPSHGLPGVPGVFGMVSMGDVDLFMLDDRYHRYPNRYPQVPEKSMFGAAQFEWLKQALLSSYATFKLVAAGNQFWNRVSRYEGLHDYPAEQQALARWLVEQKITGVVFLSGDRHFSELLKIERPGAYPLYEFTSSPLTARVFHEIPDEERDNAQIVPGTLVVQRNFGMLRVSGPRRARVLTLEAYDAGGLRLWQRRISAAELR